MNGRTLPADHGFPLRLVVPGWIGIASIKWLGRLEVSDAPVETAWNTKWYPGLSVQPVKSAVRARPGTPRCRRAATSPSRPLVVRPRADPPRRGQHRRRRQLAPRAPARTEPALRLGALGAALDPAAGRHELLARATDRSGLTQPDTVPFNEGGYQFWAVVRHPVTAAR